MDELREQLRIFLPELEAFTQHLRQVNIALRDAESELKGIWDDSFQKRFQAEVAALTGPLDDFAENDAPRFVDFLDGKRIQVERYFNG